MEALAVRLQPRPGVVEVRCPYCFDGLATAEPLWLCRRCRTAHHAECADEHGRCALFGCAPVDLVIAVRERMRRAEEAVGVAVVERSFLLVYWRWWAIPCAIVLLVVVAPVVWVWLTTPPAPIYGALF